MENRKDENPALLSICMNALDETWSKDMSVIKKALTLKMCRKYMNGDVVKTLMIYLI